MGYIGGKRLTARNTLRGLRWRVGELFFKRLFNVWQALGFHVTRNHYYEPIPDTRRLNPKLWERRLANPGIDYRDEDQVRLLAELARGWKAEWDQLPLTRPRDARPHDYHVENGGYASVDGEVLYAMIRRFKPARIIEIGCGNSTYLAARAVLANEADGAPCQLISVDPFPKDIVREGFAGLAECRPIPVQEIPLDEFSALGENDILFIDSSHVVKTGSDVQYEFLEILPRLNKGVLVHVHDIFLPAEYPEHWVKKSLQFYNEQYLLQAFLIFNERFRVVWGGHYMHLAHPELLGRAFRSYAPGRVRPGAFWMRRV